MIHATTWTNPEITLSDRRQTQKVMYCVIPFIQSVQNRQIHRKRKCMGACQGLGKRGNGESLLNGHRVLSGGDRNDLELDRDGGCTTL